MSVIAINNLTKRYGRRTGIEGIRLDVPPGAMFGFLGPNGSGKTTTIRVLLGMLQPTEGQVTVFGLDCWRESHRIKADIGYIPGDLRLYPWMDLRDGLRIVGRVRGRDLLGPGLELARRFALEPAVRVRSMSRGMRQKLGLILALAHRPRLLILDEPTSALDPPMQVALYEHLRERTVEGATVFFSSHTLSEVEELCDRVAILRDGRLVEDATLVELRARAEREVVLTWKNEAYPEDVPTFLRLVARRGCEWHCTLNGDVMALMRWCAEQPLEDVVVRPPDLDRMFRRYYEIGGGAR